MLLSVLIPTYNNAGTIKKCVESALNQDYDDDFEVVVANNASTDGTSEILSSIKDKHLRVIANHATVSLEANHNVLLRSATSDYIVYLHADDELLPEALKIISHHIKERLYPQRYILYGHSMFGDVSEWTAGQNPMLGFNTMFSGITAKRIMMSGAAPQPTGTCYSRDSILALGGFVESDRFIMQDWLLAEKAAYNYFEFEIMDRIIFRREYSMTDSKVSGKNRTEAILYTQQILWDSLNEMQREDLMQLWKIHDISIWDKFFLARISKKEKLEHCRKLIKRNPFRLRSWAKYMAFFFGLR